MTSPPVETAAGGEFLLFLIAGVIGLCLLRKLFRRRPQYRVEQVTYLRRVR